MRNRIVKELVRENTPIRTADRYSTCERYGIGYSTLIKWAREVGAVVKFGRATRFDWTKLDASVEEKLNGQQEKAM